MAQYSVPQFIEREAKIAFFISFKQMVYLIGAGVICFITYFILPFLLFVIVAIISVAAAAALAFVKVNGQPLPSIVLSSIGFLMGAKHYTWKKKEAYYPFKKIEKREKPIKEEDSSLEIGKRSKLNKRKRQIETGAK